MCCGCLCHKQAHDEVHVREDHSAAAVAVQTQRVQRLTVCARTKKKQQQHKMRSEGEIAAGNRRIWHRRLGHVARILDEELPLVTDHLAAREAAHRNDHCVVVSCCAVRHSQKQNKKAKNFTQPFVVRLVVAVDACCLLFVVTWRRALRGGVWRLAAALLRARARRCRRCGRRRARSCPPCARTVPRLRPLRLC